MDFEIYMVTVGVGLFAVTEIIILVACSGLKDLEPQLIVVLGCGNRTDKPLLNDRLESAVKAHLESPAIPILLTGDEKNKSEISSMSKYLKQRIPHANIIADPDSLNTWDSFVYIKKTFPHLNLLVITNEFHQGRSLFFARLLGLAAKPNGEDLTFKNDWYFFIRERLARLLIYKHLFVRRLKL